LLDPGTLWQLPIDETTEFYRFSFMRLMDSIVSLQEIKARLTARDFAAVHETERGPEVWAVMYQLLAVLEATSPDGVI
jgi:hypothetical protein